ncbi:tRNA threonylcarbamoyladenosine biosynthesis protein TsaE [Palleronia aestuarii]|uniref:tRNA threonylcarbamoyladenosine biosynthesis protein TsaE n=1 Tax=Palleronia aestuarii TaxID=568105 RepID=A0A2W7NEY0_9RHOB|nr:tRNA (adenosine(37)-N6)-threonylcarbamoyltransferase complex ATPase subunit type 1 TsaE [Palleronia aestuarii]PZX18991.1 tRNA threonylcarbamoyladenosine biosynthesis protein TsaE [Palleronia aestuarii]
MPELTRTLDLPDIAATDDFARALSGVLGAGDCVLLSGEMGAGKSHLARAIIQRLQTPFGRVEDVPSPTYTLVQNYAAGTLDIVHADLYRLGDPDEIEELGILDTLETALTLVEWPERMGRHRPATALRLTLEMAGTGRRARLAGDERHWAGRLGLEDAAHA